MVYIFGTLTLSVLISSLFKPGTILNNNLYAKALTFFTLAIVLYRITFREIIGDTLYYVYLFQGMFDISLSRALEFYKDDRLFLIFTWLFSQVTHSTEVFLCLMGSLFLLFFYKFLAKAFEPWQVLFVTVSYALYPFFYNYATNTIRQGLAISLILVALAYYLNDEKKWLKTIALMVFACLFHWSAVPFAVILLVLKIFNIGIKKSIFFWLIMSFLYLFDLQLKIMASLTEFIPHFTVYGDTNMVGVNLTGNRLDFYLFSLFFLLVGLYLYYFVHKEERYLKVIKTYILFNTVFLLIGFISYSDRLAAYSWFLIPVMIWIPILSKKKYLNGYSFVVLLAFSLTAIVAGIFAF